VPIAKGQPWGTPGAGLPDGAVLVASDAEARAVLEDARRQRRPFPPLALLAGDLCRTLGGGAGDREAAEARLRRGQGVRFSVDVGELLVDGHLRLFVAHLVARTHLWTRAFVAMNAQHLTVRGLGSWNLGPRAHPGDGLLDTYDARLPLSQLPIVRARLHHGTHLPHPGVREQRTAAVSVELDRPLRLLLDGEPVGRARSLVLRVIPDALVVVA
jgi:diacylglycerol kinase family enzyme